MVEQVMVIWIATIFAVMPILKYAIQKYVILDARGLELFKKNPTTYYLDFLFVPFNFFAIIIISFSVIFWAILIMVVSLGSYIIYRYWIEVHLKENIESYLFDINKKKVSKAGLVHFVYQVIQASIVFAFLFSSISSIYYYINAVILSVFLVSGIYSSKVIHGKIDKLDLVIFVLGLFILIGKVFVG